ncbi:MAG: threonine/serine exporter family protein, partial [Acutalibacteraceae bacterium]
MGEALLRNGAEIFRVQETMERVAHAYGIDEYNVY